MNKNEMNLSFNEEVVFKLRSLFEKYGFSQYKMNKFEEYDLYARNKDFLISDSVITFTDTNGKLMALKPDVTLSIIKNTDDLPTTLQKVYYNENVYRIAKGTNTFKEIMQVGLECFGDIDSYSISEVITLACKSLTSISDACVLDISHLGIINGVCDSFNIPSYAKKEIFKYISEKNTHELNSLCNKLDLNEENAETLKALASISGKADMVIPYLCELLDGIIDKELLSDFNNILNSLNDEIKDMVRIDFSVVSDTHFYNAIVFKGFINGVPVSVLSGGQYDKLLQKMKRKSGAIGFAVYLDALDRLVEVKKEYDVDTVIVYDNNTDLAVLSNKVQEIQKNGQSVFACKVIPSELKYRKLLKLTD
ncbi:MAG: ATP phosphoribosyltransferase regulatory subunit [Ruminococcus sp.]|nr:ATP phosphoribosyltransferase regulatory subunit [Ruminococcus sp.]